MGELIEGKWYRNSIDPVLSGGELRTPPSVYRRRIMASDDADGDRAFPAESGRYHLYVSLAWPLEPVAALQRVRSPGVVLALDLWDRPGRQPQVHRAAVTTLQVLEPPLHHRRKLVGPGGLEISKVGLGTATEIAKGALYLASDESAFTVATVLRIDGGIGELSV